MKTFQIGRGVEAVCESESTRYGFRHLATLLVNGYERETAKACYYNRTWESYEFQSVLRQLCDKAAKNRTLSEYHQAKFKRLVRDNWVKKAEVDARREFNAIAAVAKMADVLGANQTESNDWKTRMLKAGLENRGLIMPDDWDSLSEAEKQSRLDKVIAQLEK